MRYCELSSKSRAGRELTSQICSLTDIFKEYFEAELGFMFENSWVGDEYGLYRSEIRIFHFEVYSGRRSLISNDFSGSVLVLIVS